MSSPKIIVQIAIAGAQILGKAFVAAGRQAIQNAKHRPQAALGGDAAGVQNATSGSHTDRLTREHRMTPDEARLILNVKKDDPAELLHQRYEHLFRANSPPPLPPKPPGSGTGRAQPGPAHSHYLQSKVVRALQRLQAEASTGEHPTPPPPPPPSSNPPPPPPS
ncbi:hypothetical protein BKA93DRAFT_817143 [Sparassis latifolia]